MSHSQRNPAFIRPNETSRPSRQRHDQAHHTSGYQDSMSQAPSNVYDNNSTVPYPPQAGTRFNKSRPSDGRQPSVSSSYRGVNFSCPASSFHAATNQNQSLYSYPPRPRKQDCFSNHDNYDPMSKHGHQYHSRPFPPTRIYSHRTAHTMRNPYPPVANGLKYPNMRPPKLPPPNFPSYYGKKYYSCNENHSVSSDSTPKIIVEEPDDPKQPEASGEQLYYNATTGSSVYEVTYEGRTSGEAATSDGETVGGATVPKNAETESGKELVIFSDIQSGNCNDTRGGRKPGVLYANGEDIEQQGLYRNYPQYDYYGDEHMYQNHYGEYDYSQQHSTGNQQQYGYPYYQTGPGYDEIKDGFYQNVHELTDTQNPTANLANNKTQNPAYQIAYTPETFDGNRETVKDIQVDKGSSTQELTAQSGIEALVENKDVADYENAFKSKGSSNHDFLRHRAPDEVLHANRSTNMYQSQSDTIEAEPKCVDKNKNGDTPVVRADDFKKENHIIEREYAYIKAIEKEVKVLVALDMPHPKIEQQIDAKVQHAAEVFENKSQDLIKKQQIIEKKVRDNFKKTYVYARNAERPVNDDTITKVGFYAKMGNGALRREELIERNLLLFSDGEKRSSGIKFSNALLFLKAMHLNADGCDDYLNQVKVLKKKFESDEAYYSEQKLRLRLLREQKIQMEIFKKEQLKKEKIEKEKFEKEKLEKGNSEKGMLEKEKLENEKLEKNELEKQNFKNGYILKLSAQKTGEFSSYQNNARAAMPTKHKFNERVVSQKHDLEIALDDKMTMPSESEGTNNSINFGKDIDTVSRTGVNSCAGNPLFKGVKPLLLDTCKVPALAPEIKLKNLPVFDLWNRKRKPEEERPGIKRPKSWSSGTSLVDAQAEKNEDNILEKLRTNNDIEKFKLENSMLILEAKIKKQKEELSQQKILQTNRLLDPQTPISSEVLADPLNSSISLNTQVKGGSSMIDPLGEVDSPSEFIKSDVLTDNDSEEVRNIEKTIMQLKREKQSLEECVRRDSGHFESCKSAYKPRDVYIPENTIKNQYPASSSTRQYLYKRSSSSHDIYCPTSDTYSPLNNKRLKSLSAPFEGEPPLRKFFQKNLISSDQMPSKSSLKPEDPEKKKPTGKVSFKDSIRCLSFDTSSCDILWEGYIKMTTMDARRHKDFAASIRSKDFWKDLPKLNM